MTITTPSQNMTRHAGQTGYSLFEMLAVMLIFGITMVAVAQMTSDYYTQQKELDHLRRMDTVTAAISKFVYENGRYPCVARIDRTPNSPIIDKKIDAGEDYGEEANCAPGAPPIGKPVQAVNNCGHGFEWPVVPEPAYCVRSRGGLGGPKVLVGMVPFKTIGLPEKFAYDIHGNRLTYIVTQELAVQSTFDANKGAIGIYKTGTLNASETVEVIAADSVLKDANTAHFVLISHGQNAKGAFNKMGGRQACGSAAENGLDRLNCATRGNPDYISTWTKGATPETFFDDDVRFVSQRMPQLWKNIAANSIDLTLSSNKAGAGMYIGVKNDTYKTAIDMPVRTTDNASATKLCNPGDPNSCFDAKIIAGKAEDPENPGHALPPPGSPPGTKGPPLDEKKKGLAACPNTKAAGWMRGLQDDGSAMGSKQNCADLEMTCPEGKVAVGVREKPGTNVAELICATIEKKSPPQMVVTVSDYGLKKNGSIDPAKLLNDGDGVTFSISLHSQNIVPGSEDFVNNPNGITVSYSLTGCTVNGTQSANVGGLATSDATTDIIAKNGTVTFPFKAKGGALTQTITLNPVVQKRHYVFDGADNLGPKCFGLKINPGNYDIGTDAAPDKDGLGVAFVRPRAIEQPFCEADAKYPLHIGGNTHNILATSAYPDIKIWGLSSDLMDPLDIGQQKADKSIHITVPDGHNGNRTISIQPASWEEVCKLDAEGNPIPDDDNPGKCLIDHKNPIYNPIRYTANLACRCGGNEYCTQNNVDWFQYGDIVSIAPPAGNQ